MSTRLLSLSLLLTSSCGSSTPDRAHAPTDPPPPPAVTTGVDAVALERAVSTMQTLGTTLKSALVATMTQGGPVAALEVCSQSARSTTAAVATRTGVEVGRSSLRLRNPDNAAPSWVADWLAHQGERSAEGVQRQVSTGSLEDGRATVRVVAPLAIEPPCLVCHGPGPQQSPDLAAALSARYPDDKATNYALGDLRGAIWAEAPVVDAHLALERDGEARWMLDASTREAAAAIRRSTAGPAPTHLDAAHAVAAEIDGSVSRMIQGCSMEGASHDQLHHFLEALFPAIHALQQATDRAEARDAYFRIRGQVVVFDATFE